MPERWYGIIIRLRCRGCGYQQTAITEDAKLFFPDSCPQCGVKEWPVDEPEP